MADSIELKDDWDDDSDIGEVAWDDDEEDEEEEEEEEEGEDD